MTACSVIDWLVISINLATTDWWYYSHLVTIVKFTIIFYVFVVDRHYDLHGDKIGELGLQPLEHTGGSLSILDFKLHSVFPNDFPRLSEKTYHDFHANDYSIGVTTILVRPQCDDVCGVV